MKARRGKQFNQANFACAINVRAAAGTEVDPAELHQPHRAGQRLFAAVGQHFQLTWIGIPDFGRNIGPDRLICGQLHFGQRLRGQFSAEIDGDNVAAHMESDIFKAKAGVNDAGDQMFTRMLLRQIKAARPINGTLDLLPDLQGRVGKVYDLVPPFLNVQHPCLPDLAEVTRLAAARRIEDRPVEHYLPAVFRRFTGKNACIQRSCLRLQIIKPFRRHSFCSVPIFHTIVPHPCK